MSEIPKAKPWSRVRWRLVLLAPTIVLLIVLASYPVYCGVIRWAGNFGVVEKGKFYRSAQLDKDGLERAVKDYGVRSILNLRGANKAGWYRDEIAVSQALGVMHYDYRLKADQAATPRQIDAILKIIQAAPKPILVHCRAGSDRSGLVSALYLVAIDDADPEVAAKQLSLLYGHFPYLTSRTGAMDQSFWTYVRSKRLGVK